LRTGKGLTIFRKRGLALGWRKRGKPFFDQRRKSHKLLHFIRRKGKRPLREEGGSGGEPKTIQMGEKKRNVTKEGSEKLLPGDYESSLRGERGRRMPANRVERKFDRHL